jgi:hypothetical protein
VFALGLISWRTLTDSARKPLERIESSMGDQLSSPPTKGRSSLAPRAQYEADAADRCSVEWTKVARRPRVDPGPVIVLLSNGLG